MGSHDMHHAMSMDEDKHMDMHMDSGMMMHDMFFTTRSKSTLLLEIWDTSTLSGFIVGMISTVMLSIFEEFVGWKLSRYSLYMTEKLKRLGRSEARLKDKLIMTAYHFGRVVIGYLLMMFIMTYNIWMFVSILLGAGVGHFLVNLYQRCNDQSARNTQTDDFLIKGENVPYNTESEKNGLVY